jgi:endonuclease YncB( thermonuclease family)
MRLVLLLLILLVLPSGVRAAEPATALIFEKVLDGASFVASGENVALWGVEAPVPSDPDASTAELYLQTVLRGDALRCDEKRREGRLHVMQCFIDNADVGSLVVQLGMARATEPYYAGEQAYAQTRHLGLWHGRQGAPL